MAEQLNRMNLLRMSGLKQKIGLGKTTINEMVKRGEFPKPIPLGARAVAWLESDVDAWVLGKVQAAEGAK